MMLKVFYLIIIISDGPYSKPSVDIEQIGPFQTENQCIEFKNKLNHDIEEYIKNITMKCVELTKEKT